MRWAFFILLLLTLPKSAAADGPPPKHADGARKAPRIASTFDAYFEDLVACIDRMRNEKTGLVSDKVGIKRLANDDFEIEKLKPEDGRPTHNEDTSPTNIGLDMLVQLERISWRSKTVEAEQNLTKVLATLARLPRHPESGLFFSWYQAADGKPTNRNVSSVDNIHLALALWVVAKAGPSPTVRERAKRLFDGMSFKPFLRKDTGFVGGNLKHEGDGWKLEGWDYAYLGSEARSVYSLGWALGLFQGVEEPVIRKGLEKLSAECTRWKDGDRTTELLHTWDGGLFQHFLPELLVGERRYSPEFARRIGAVALFAYAEGKRLKLTLGKETLPVAASASNGGVDFVKQMGDAPDYVAHSGVLRLASTQNSARNEPDKRKHWQNLLTPHAVFLMSLFEKNRALRTLATLENVEGPAVLTDTKKEALYLKGCGFMDGYWTSGENKGMVVPVVLHLDHSMAALAAAAHRRQGTLTFSADTLRRDPSVAARLQMVYDAFEERVDKAAARCVAEIRDVTVPK